MRISTFKKFLDSLSEESLKQELLDLYTKNKEVKTYYLMELGTEEDRKKIYDRAKKAIQSKFKTKSYRKPKRPRISKVNAILKDLHSLSIFKDEMADLYLYNCEVALHFMEEYYYYSEPVVNNIYKSFEAACKLIQADMTEDHFEKRCNHIVDLAYDLNEYLGEALKDTMSTYF